MDVTEDSIRMPEAPLSMRRTLTTERRTEVTRGGDVRTAGGCWPTDDQVLLLRAAILEPDKAAAAWRLWRAARDPETAEPSSARLFPLVHPNLCREALAGPDEDLLRRAYDAARARNELLFDLAAEALRRLHEHEIPTMVLKGAALAVAYYRD